MKKLLLLISAVICAVCAYAQSVANPLVSDITFNVPGQTPAVDEDGQRIEDTYTVGSVDSTVTITFVGYDSALAEELGLTPYLMTLSGMGYGVDPEVEPLVPVNDMAEKELGDAWGNPYLGNYYVNLIVCFMDEAGDFYMVDDEPLFYQVVYTTKNTTVEFASVYPNNDWSKETFSEAYNRGEIRFNFTNNLTLDEEAVIGEINYTRFDGAPVDPVDIIIGVNADAGWNPMDGNYTISIKYSLEGVAAKELSEIEIYLYPLQSPYGNVMVAPVVLENNSSNLNRIAKKSTAGTELAVSTENVSVYNVAGVLIKENVALSEVNQLPKGLYIVNGKKVVVK